MTRRLRRTSDRQFDVLVNDVRVGVVWRAGTDADDAGRWRASDASGLAEWRPWAFYRTPQDAARACVREHEQRS